MDIKEYQKFREDRKQSRSDGLDIAWDFRVCAEYLNKLAEAVKGTDDVIELIAVVERAKTALYWTESTCTVANALYGTFKDMEEIQSEACTDNSYVTITYELEDKDGEHEGSE